MFNYIRAELYRLGHKKSIYIIYAIVSIGFFLLLFSTQNPQDFAAVHLLEIGTVLINLAMIFFGSFSFICVYCDDLPAQKLGQNFGNGLARHSYVLGKSLVLGIQMILTYAYCALLYLLASAFLTHGFPDGIFPEVWAELVLHALSASLSVVVYAAIVSAFTYLTQSSAASIALFIICLSGIPAQIIGTLSALNPVMDFINRNTWFTIVQRGYMSQHVDAILLTKTLLWYLVPSGIAVLFLSKRDIKFA